MKNIQIYISALFVILAVVPAWAQAAPPATPIDGGLSLLLVAGGAYGLKKIYSNRK